MFKKIFLTAVIAVASLSASAEIEPGFRMGVFANLGASSVIYDGSEMSFGYGLGWIAEYNFSDKFFVQSGVGFENIAHSGVNIDGTINAYYAQIPIFAGYRFGLGNDLQLFVQAGPTIGIGLFGSKLIYNDSSEANWFDSASRFDLSLGGRVGVEFSNFQISVGTNGGLTTVANGSGHTFNLNARVAYMF